MKSTPSPARSWCLAVVLLFLHCGCRSHHSAYSGPTLPPGDLATLTGNLPLFLVDIDGKRGPNFQGLGFPKAYNSKWDGTFAVELPAGSHTLRMTWLGGPWKTMTVQLNGGRKYLLKESSSAGQNREPVIVEVE